MAPPTTACCVAQRAPLGRRSAVARLRNETYVGTLPFNRSPKLKTPRRDNPIEEWVRTPEAVVSMD